MKKVGLLLLALVIALGALGVGYAKWSDNVTINGTVNTGTLILGIKDISTNDPRTFGENDVVTNVSKDPLCSPDTNVPAGTELKDVAYINSANGSAKVDDQQNDLCPGYYSGITETIGNAYPGYNPSTTFEFKNCGTVPLKLETIAITSSSGYNLIPWMYINWNLVDEFGASYSGSGDYDAFYAALHGQQIGGGKTVTVTVGICFKEYAMVDNVKTIMPQGKTGTYVVTVTGSQWNEVSVNPVLPSPDPSSTPK